MKRTAFVIAALAVASAAPAQATTLVLPDGRVAQPYQQWVDRAFIPTIQQTVTLHLEACPDSTRGEGGCTFVGTTDVWLNEPLTPRVALLHELGHQFDYWAMTDAARDEFRQLVGDPRPWRSAPNSPHEKFAEAYGFCARHRRIKNLDNTTLGYGYEPTPRMHKMVCALIRRAGRSR